MPAPQTLRVMVVDDHAVLRLGLERLIESEAPRLACVGGAASADEALLRVHEWRPDVVVLDVDLGGDDGLMLIPLLRRAVCCEIVVLTSLLDRRIAELAQRCGAWACVRKTAPAAELLERIVASGAARGVTTDPANAGSAMSRVAGAKHP